MSRKWQEPRIGVLAPYLLLSESLQKWWTRRKREWICEHKLMAWGEGVFEDIGVWVWVSIKQNHGARQMDVNGRQEVPCLFIFASLGDKTDRACNLRVNKAPFLLRISSTLGSLTSIAGICSPIYLFTQFGPSFLRKQLSAVVLNWGTLLPRMPNLV